MLEKVVNVMIRFIEKIGEIYFGCDLSTPEMGFQARLKS